MKLEFNKIIHFNRDENSFTARVFESCLFPLWKIKPSSFTQFTKLLLSQSKDNYDFLLKKFKNIGIKKFKTEKDLSFADAILFLENMDIYGFCVNNKIRIELNSSNIDKTEFDCVVITKDEDGNEIILVFEIKCFTDLKYESLKRQNNLLIKYKDAHLFSEFYHFAIISNENISNGRIFTNNDLNTFKNGIYIISWRNIFKYIEDCRVSARMRLASHLC